MVAFCPDDLVELLPVYYRRLFPYKPFYRWLSYGLANPNSFSHREMSFTLAGDIYIRYQSFDKLEDFEAELQKKCPEKIDIGAIYTAKPRLKRMTSHFDVEEKELVFDIDMTDYDSVRTCCKDAEVCIKCWKLISVACKILDTALRDDFGFEHLLWVFSGRRGVHCWVCDESARKLDSKVRSSIAEYLQILSREDASGKVAHIFPEQFHPSIKRSVEIIKKEFESMCIEDQNLLEDEEMSNKFLGMLPKNLRERVKAAWDGGLSTSLERWRALVSVYTSMFRKGELDKRRSLYLIEELMLHFAYPRLDIEVSKGQNHLLKSPFCIHPKTGKICVPFNPSSADKFNPETVPTISDLVEEIREFDKKNTDISSQDDVKRKVKDYKKTSMFKGMRVFEEFLRKLEDSLKSKQPKSEEMEF